MKMKKCAKCGKISDDGKVWIFQKEEKAKTMEIVYCSSCKLQMDLDFCNIIFWREK